MANKVHGTPEELNILDREEGWHPEISGQQAVKGNKNKKSIERYEKSAKAAKEGNVQTLIKQIQKEVWDLKIEDKKKKLIRGGKKSLEYL